MTSTLNTSFTTRTAPWAGAGFGLRVLWVADSCLRAIRDAAAKAVRMGSPLAMTADSRAIGIAVYATAGNRHPLAARSAG